MYRRGGFGLAADFNSGRQSLFCKNDRDHHPGNQTTGIQASRGMLVMLYRFHDPVKSIRIGRRFAWIG